MNNLIIIEQHKNAVKRLQKVFKWKIKKDCYSNSGQLVKDISKAIYNKLYNKNLYTPFTYDDAIDLKDSLKYDYNFINAEKVNKARKERVVRYRERINKIITISKVFNNDYVALFITFTFKDELLSNTNELTRRRYIARELKEKTLYYIANIDYGLTSEREHYHAVALCKRSILDKKIKFGQYFVDVVSNKYGYTTSEIIKISDDWSSIRISKYMQKLYNHGFKDSVDNNHFLYSSKSKQLQHLYYDAKETNLINQYQAMFNNELIVE